jgi:hypothetical protein
MIDRLLRHLGLVACLSSGFAFVVPGMALAAPCGSSARPSTQAGCTCAKGQTKRSAYRAVPPVRTSRGTYQYNFKLRMRRATKVCRKASRLARQKKCLVTRKRKVVRFSWRKLRKRVRFFMGYRKGFCRIAWSCRYKRKAKVYWCQP